MYRKPSTCYKPISKQIRFIVLVDETVPEDIVAWIFDAFETGEAHTVDEGCLLELGYFQRHTGSICSTMI